MRVRSVTKSPVFPDDSDPAERWQRRAKGIAIETQALLWLTVLFPVVLAVAAVVDLALWLVRRKPWMAVRLVAFAWWFLLGEVRCFLLLVGVWAITGGPVGRGSLARRRLVYDLRIHWASSHLAGVRVLFGLRFEV